MSYLKIGGAAALVVAVLVYVWSAERAKERAQTYRAERDTAIETAKHNAEVGRFLRADARHTEDLLAKRERERNRLAKETEALRGRLRDALEEAPDEVRECLPVRLPGAVRDGLYGPESRTED